MDIIYEKAVPADLDELCSVIKRAVEKMDSMGIFQWDEVYPDRATLQDDIEKGQMYVGRAGGRIAVMFSMTSPITMLRGKPPMCPTECSTDFALTLIFRAAEWAAKLLTTSKSFFRSRGFMLFE